MLSEGTPRLSARWPTPIPPIRLAFSREFSCGCRCLYNEYDLDQHPGYPAELTMQYAEKCEGHADHLDLMLRAGGSGDIRGLKTVARGEHGDFDTQTVDVVEAPEVLKLYYDRFMETCTVDWES